MEDASPRKSSGQLKQDMEETLARMSSLPKLSDPNQGGMATKEDAAADRLRDLEAELEDSKKTTEFLMGRQSWAAPLSPLGVCPPLSPVPGSAHPLSPEAISPMLPEAHMHAVRELDDQRQLAQTLQQRLQLTEQREAEQREHREKEKAIHGLHEQIGQLRAVSAKLESDKQAAEEERLEKERQVQRYKAEIGELKHETDKADMKKSLQEAELEAKTAVLEKCRSANDDEMERLRVAEAEISEQRELTVVLESRRAEREGELIRLKGQNEALRKQHELLKELMEQETMQMTQLVAELDRMREAAEGMKERRSNVQKSMHEAKDALSRQEQHQHHSEEQARRGEAELAMAMHEQAMHTQFQHRMLECEQRENAVALLERRLRRHYDMKERIAQPVVVERALGSVPKSHAARSPTAERFAHKLEQKRLAVEQAQRLELEPAEEPTEHEAALGRTEQLSVDALTALQAAATILSPSPKDQQSPPGNYCTVTQSPSVVLESPAAHESSGEISRLQMQVQDAQRQQHLAAMQMQHMHAEVEAWKGRSAAAVAAAAASPALDQEARQKLEVLESSVEEAMAQRDMLMADSEAKDQQLERFQRDFEQASSAAAAAEERCAYLTKQLDQLGFFM